MAASAVAAAGRSVGLEHLISNKAIAWLLVVTEHTVEKHVKNIFATLGLPPSADEHRRVMAVLTFLNSQ